MSAKELKKVVKILKSTAVPKGKLIVINMPRKFGKNTLLKKNLTELGKAAGASIDQEVRDVLLTGTMVFGDNAYGVMNGMNSFQKFWFRTRTKISVFRVRLGEWIGGDQLHRYCED